MGLGKYLAGRQAQIESDHKSAADYYLHALEADPTNVMLARRTYTFLLAEGKVREGMDVARRVLELDPKEDFAPLMLAVDAVKAGSYQAAIDRLDGLSDKGLNMLMLPLIRAWALAGAERWDEALTALAPLRTNRELVMLHDFHAGLILELAGRTDEALKVYSASLTGEQAPSVRAVQVVASFLYRNGHETEALELIDSVRREQNRSPLIEALFGAAGTGDPKKAAGRSLPQPVTSAREGLAEALFGAASLMSTANIQDMAMISARLTIDLRPDFPFGTYMIASILEKQERYEQMIALLKPIPRSNPAYYLLRLRLAAAYDRQDRQDEAIAVLRDLTKIYPEQVDPIIAEAGLFHRQKKWKDAARLYQKAIDTFAEPAPAQWHLFYALGMCLERGGRWPEAEKALKMALQLNPDQPLVLNYLGYSWIDRGMNLDQGKALIEKAVAQMPTEGYIIDSLGWAYYLTGDYERAVTELERAIEYTPADPTMNEHLGDAYWRVGRLNEARFQWQRALTLDPEPETIAPIKEKLKKGMPAAKPKGK
jgi:tetratricopeptide (TPR) repeat protein